MSPKTNGTDIIAVKQEAPRINIARAINQAIAALGKGNTDKARAKLQQVLAIDPDNASARNFLEQINMDPVVYFGPEYFEYKAGSGDSMTRIADRFLKDHLKFYILTRYSGLKNPASLVTGQVIRIPLRYKPDVSAGIATRSKASYGDNKAPANPASDDSNLKLASTYLQEARATDAIQILESSTAGKTAQGNKLLETAYSMEAGKLERAGELKTAVLLYRKALKINPQASEYSERISALSDLSKARDHQRLASLYLKSGQLDMALDNINTSLQLAPESEAGRTLYQKIKAGAVTQYHANAVALFNDDRFQEALALWETALTLDPTHLLSRSFHERCKRMLDRQQEFAMSYSEDN